MVHTFLDFAVTNDFKISFGWFGVSELRHTLIIFNAFMVFFGEGLLVSVFPFTVAALCVGLCIAVYKSQKLYREMDMILKMENEDAMDKQMAVSMH